MEISKRQRRIAAKKALKEAPHKFEAIDLSIRPHPDWMTRAFRNNRFTVMIDDQAATTHGPAIRAMIQNHTDTPIKNHWSEIQSIKNEIFGEETMAIEYYPANSELVNLHNIYWIWIFPAGVIPKPMHP
jgi:hypothetical protein